MATPEEIKHAQEDYEQSFRKTIKHRAEKGLPLNAGDIRNLEDKDLKIFLKERGYKDFLPLIHGTSKKNAEQIMQVGLKPREETQKESNWSSWIQKGNLSSEPDKVYFARCQDSRITKSSARLAAKNDNDELAFLALENIEPYQKAMVEDEDWRNAKEIIIEGSIYDFDPNKYYKRKFGGIDFCWDRIPHEVIDYWDKMWYICQSNNPDPQYATHCFKSALDDIPQGLRSIYMAQTLAIKKTIDPKDLKVLNEKEYADIRDKCHKDNGGCNLEERRLKDEYTNAIRDYNKYHHFHSYQLDNNCFKIQDEDKRKFYCPKYPEWYLGVMANPEYKTKIDTMTPEIDETIGKEIDLRLEKSRNRLLEYIKKHKIEPKYGNSEILDDADYPLED